LGCHVPASDNSTKNIWRDINPSFQQIAFIDQGTGEWGKLHLKHTDGDAERFDRDLQSRGTKVYQRAIELCDIQGLGGRDAAATLGISVTALQNMPTAC
jgi:DNA-directed RNA polymerase specialized sigma24 family protein